MKINVDYLQGIEIDDSLDHPFSVENTVTLSPYSVDGDTSPKPVTKHPRYVQLIDFSLFNVKLIVSKLSFFCLTFKK